MRTFWWTKHWNSEIRKFFNFNWCEMNELVFNKYIYLNIGVVFNILTSIYDIYYNYYYYDCCSLWAALSQCSHFLLLSWKCVSRIWELRPSIRPFYYKHLHHCGVVYVKCVRCAHRAPIIRIITIECLPYTESPSFLAHFHINKLNVSAFYSVGFNYEPKWVYNTFVECVFFVHVFLLLLFLLQTCVMCVCVFWL